MLYIASIMKDTVLEYMVIRLARLSAYYKRIPDGQLQLCLRSYAEMNNVQRMHLNEQFPKLCKRMDKLMLDYQEVY